MLVCRGMGPDVWVLLQRDHDELDDALADVFAPWTTPEQKHGALVRFRIGFIAHAEGQAEALRVVLEPARPAPVREAVTRILAAHDAQESVLHGMQAATPSDASWHEYARQLRDLHRAHAAHERAARATLSAHVPTSVFRQLAQAYATARLRTLGMLHPMSWRLA